MKIKISQYNSLAHFIDGWQKRLRQHQEVRRFEKQLKISRELTSIIGNSNKAKESEFISLHVKLFGCAATSPLEQSAGVVP